METVEVHIRFYGGNLRKEDHLENHREVELGTRTGLNWLRIGNGEEFL
jgi:hypothetical protein